MRWKLLLFVLAVCLVELAEAYPKRPGDTPDVIVFDSDRYLDTLPKTRRGRLDLFASRVWAKHQMINYNVSAVDMREADIHIRAEEDTGKIIMWKELDIRRRRVAECMRVSSENTTEEINLVYKAIITNPMMYRLTRITELDWRDAIVPGRDYWLDNYKWNVSQPQRNVSFPLYGPDFRATYLEVSAKLFPNSAFREEALVVTQVLILPNWVSMTMWNDTKHLSRGTIKMNMIADRWPRNVKTMKFKAQMKITDIGNSTYRLGADRWSKLWKKADLAYMRLSKHYILEPAIWSQMPDNYPQVKHGETVVIKFTKFRGRFLFDPLITLYDTPAEDDGEEELDDYFKPDDEKAEVVYDTSDYHDDDDYGNEDVKIAPDYEML